MKSYRLRRGHLELLVELAPVVARKAGAGPCMHVNGSWDYWRDLHARLEEALRSAGLIQHEGYAPSWEFPRPEEEETR
jgi:hypothetical protein